MIQNIFKQRELSVFQKPILGWSARRQTKKLQDVHRRTLQ